jgi:hypothetical protein
MRCIGHGVPGINSLLPLLLVTHGCLHNVIAHPLLAALATDRMKCYKLYAALGAFAKAIVLNMRIPATPLRCAGHRPNHRKEHAAANR